MLFPKSQLLRKVLTYFFFNPKEKLYLLELARKLKADPGNLDKMLKKLEKEGLFLSTMEGKQKYYYLNRHYPFYTEYESIVEKMFGIVPMLKLNLAQIKGIRKAYLFGSFARGKIDELSDIDLLLIGNFDGLELAKRLQQLEKNFGRPINAVEMTEEEFLRRKNRKDPFVKHVFKNSYLELV